MALNPSAVAIQAAMDGNLRLLKKMASKMDLREAKHPNEGNLLHYAAFKGRLEVCRFLVEESGLDVNSTTPDGETPIAVAATCGKVSILRYLLDHGGDPGMPDAEGDTPLHDAADRGHYEPVRLLLSRGVDVDPLNNCRLAPLNMAAGKGHDQVVKVLLEHGADPNRVAHNMFAPLMMACSAGSLKCIKLLVEAGAAINFKSPYGSSLLMKAVTTGLTDIVKFLLEAGADPDISDEFGENPLMQAARNGRRDLVEILFPQTKPIASLPNWSVDGIIATMKYMPFMLKDACLTKENILAHLKPRGDEAFAKGDYLGATYLYGLAMHVDPLDAILFSNRSQCWLRLGDGGLALLDAQQCRMLRPHWPKAWYREGTALSSLKNYKGAASALLEALNLDPANEEIKTALRETIEALRCAAHSAEQNR
ncbi:unnamed protein product [Urochloa decumbens]|uniref:Uncharacterized protein n=1 Tax=Urochloa decumbens TaxID=240449 RepID=A0ABC8W9D1_9POAL